MSSEKIEKLKQEFLPKSVREFFEINRKLLQKNVDTLSSLKAPTGATEGEKALVIMFSTLGCKIYSDFLTIERDLELGFLTSAIQRKKIDQVLDQLDEQGIKIDNLTQYKEGLRFVDEYIKRNSENTSLE